ncbi:hypothetical protein QF019_002853 [Pseudomonas frederiksbergensis]
MNTWLAATPAVGKVIAPQNLVARTAEKLLTF